MTFPNKDNFELSLALNTSQAEQKLAEFYSKLLRIQKELENLKLANTSELSTKQSENTLSTLGKAWEELAQKIEKAAEFKQTFEESPPSKNALDTIQTLKSRVVAISNASQSQSFNPFSSIVDSFTHIKENNNSVFSILSNGLTTLTKWHKSFTGFKNDAQHAGQSLGDFLQKGGISKASFADFAVQAVEMTSKLFSRNKSILSKAFGNTLNGAFTGALSGLSAGPIGGIIGGLLGAVNSSSALAAGKFDTKSALKGLPFGLVGFAVSGFLGAAKKAAEKQKQLEQTQKAMQSILAQADQNDLNSLQKALSQVIRYRSGGGSAFLEKSNAAKQLQQAIKARKDVIFTAIQDLESQNSILEKLLQKSDALPFDNLQIDREIELQRFASERDKLLEQFKDSASMQLQIQENFELKRQTLLKDSSLEIINVAIEEQNQIRELRAQTAINDAKFSGNRISLINAELQARLVSIDNDIALFRGAEELKTEFLKAKTTERTALVKEANDQVNDLLQQGLSILNEGLVTSETKAQKQGKRLENLFGKLDPLGLIQASSQQLQTNVTIGSGAFQFILQGIQDAQDLITQLKDPLVQSQLQQALNAVVARG